MKFCKMVRFSRTFLHHFFKDIVTLGDDMGIKLEGVLEEINLFYSMQIIR